jgi:hypothetical protein
MSAAGAMRCLAENFVDSSTAGVERLSVRLSVANSCAATGIHIDRTIVSTERNLIKYKKEEKMMSRKISLKKFENNPMSLHKKWQYLNAITKVVENIEFSASFLPQKNPAKKS